MHHRPHPHLKALKGIIKNFPDSRKTPGSFIWTSIGSCRGMYMYVVLNTRFPTPAYGNVCSVIFINCLSNSLFQSNHNYYLPSSIKMTFGINHVLLYLAYVSYNEIQCLNYINKLLVNDFTFYLKHCQSTWHHLYNTVVSLKGLKKAQWINLCGLITKGFTGQY